MRAMDYISSTNICYLICDTLRLIDSRPIEHGMRVAYMLMKLLECKGGYDEYETAEFVFLAMIHDIGAYKTEKLSDEFLYDEEESGNPHAIYGALFLNDVSPFGARSDIIKYHHLPYSKLKGINYEYSKIAMYLSLLEDVDALYRRKGTELDYHVFEAEAGKRYLSEAVVSLLKCIRRDGMLEKLASGEYEKELREYMDYVLFTNEEKENYLRFVMHCYSLRGKMRTVEAIMCGCVAHAIAESMDLTGREKERLDYASMLHDIGMLSVDKDILKGTKELTEEEAEKIRQHVEIGTELLKKYFKEQDVPELVETHHELLDGSGYPKGLHDGDMTSSQCILQVADCATSMMNKKKNRQPMGREEILGVLRQHVESGKLNRRAVRGVIENYEMIDKRIQSETRAFLTMHVRINNKYKLLVDNNLGEEA